MFKTFKAFFKHTFKNKWKAVAYIILLFIPFVYGFFYMNAYWAPFKNTDQLKIGIVNLDSDNNVPSKESENLRNKIINNGKNLKLGKETYHLNIQSIEDIYSPEEAEGKVNDGDYAALIVIPHGYSKSIKKVKSELKKSFLTIATSSDPFGDINKIISKHNIVKLQYYNSYKNNFLEGEMTNFGAGLWSLGFHAMLPANIPPVIKGFVDIIESQISSNIDNVLHVHSLRREGTLNTYGYGLSPYFISIALWAGCLTMTFVIKNERQAKTVRTIKHYFGKTLVWIMTGWAQATILLTAITIQGVNLGWESQWQLWLFVYFASAVFSMLVQAITYCFRFGDIGEFVVVIFLVLQLISSSGTFPVEMQGIVFKILHPIAPFTYTVNAIREIFYEPNWITILENMAMLLAFPAVFIPISLFINYRFDRKNNKIINSKKEYKSFEIHMGDL